MAIGIGGCVTAQKPGDVLENGVSKGGVNSTTEEEKTRKRTHIQAQTRNLDTARALLQEGKTSTAKEILVNIVSTEGVPGITDEALFRLAMLNIDGGQGKTEISQGDIAQAQSSLDRLIKEYPTSSWRKHSESLVELIAALNRRIKSLKGENLFLSRENKELRLNIERLKILDIEQELKVKR